MTLLDRSGTRILPAYCSDNYLSLLPGETREVVISYRAKRIGGATVAVRGWNTSADKVVVANSQ